ncbi:MAG: alpha/beta hydrolase [Ignavibacteriales bacterium CG_4_9_14_3_um_filter_30_11]|nr:MAG: alpha/beta hydrolase [Ignavibacteriales bacterium CG_4_9_14_3_um_filter_30_11]
MKTFVLIHGSYHGAWNWHKVVPILEKNGHKAISLDMPGHGIDKQKLHTVTFNDCVNKIATALNNVKGKVILLAHSRNGIVISQVAEQCPEKIEKLIYLASYLVPNGKSMMDYALLDTESLVMQNVVPKIDIKRAIQLNRNFIGFKKHLFSYLLPTKLKTHKLSPHIFKKALYHDCPDEITELANVLLSPEPNLGGFEKLQLSENGYGKIPRIYIECLQDRAVTLALQRKMQNDSPCEKVYQIDTSHSPFFSKPQELCEILLDIAKL